MWNVQVIRGPFPTKQEAAQYAAHAAAQWDRSKVIRVGVVPSAKQKHRTAEHRRPL